MATYSHEVFRWSGTHYNALYNTSYTATFNDNDGLYQGGVDGDETVSIDGGAAGTTAGTGYNIQVSFTDVAGNPHVETFHFFNTGGAWYFVPGPGSDFTVGATLGSYQSHDSLGWSYTDVLCFAKGTLIETNQGNMAVEDLTPGMQVKCADGHFQTLRLALTTRFDGFCQYKNPKLRPVRIVAGALGNGLPKQDLLVSRQHRMLVQSKIAERMFGQTDVLISAIRLTALPGIFVEDQISDVSYFHLVFDKHEIVLANGAPSESLFAGPNALKTLTRENQDELRAFFPQLCNDALPNAISPHYIPQRKQQVRLVERMAKNQQQALQNWQHPSL